MSLHAFGWWKQILAHQGISLRIETKHVYTSKFSSGKFNLLTYNAMCISSSIQYYVIICMHCMGLPNAYCRSLHCIAIQAVVSSWQRMQCGAIFAWSLVYSVEFLYLNLHRQHWWVFPVRCPILRGTHILLVITSFATQVVYEVRISIIYIFTNQ